MQKVPLPATEIPEQEQKTDYPKPFASVVEGRVKRKLGDFFGLGNFGVNLTELLPGAASALLHHHSQQDELIYILEGQPVLILGEQEYPMIPGDCCGFKAGAGTGHQLINRGMNPVRYLEIGDRTIGDQVEYPNDDLRATQLENGVCLLTHKDGSPYA